MRITGGIHKGRRIKVAANNSLLRPTRALIREAYFSIIGNSFCQGRTFVDFFSGTGIMALEAMSRGANPVFCVEQDRKTVSVLQKNLDSLFDVEHSSSCTILACSVQKSISYFKKQKLQLDLAYIDPPYREIESGISLLAEIYRAGLIDSGVRLALEHPSEINFTLGSPFTVLKQKKYGRTSLSLITVLRT